MKRYITGNLIIAGVFIILFVTFQGCKKQAKCGCGKDVIYTLTNSQVMVQYNEASNTVIFYPVYSNGSTYYFCNPGQWMDSLKKMNTQQYVLVSGKAYYECNYLMQSANYSYLPPVYQVEVTGLKEDNYGK
jgi:YHS domain-containing protein